VIDGRMRGWINPPQPVPQPARAEATRGTERRTDTMHPLLTIAVKAARRAGNVINRGAQDLDRLTITVKGPKDFVSEVDRAAEAAIVETLHSAYPDHAILAEEGTAKGRNVDADHVWIIDPLDGTTNFLHGMPQYCVSIALQHKQQITQAVIYDPVRNDLFTATRGRGAFLNDRRLRVSRRQHLKDCLIGTGFPFRDGSFLDTYLAMMKTMIVETAGIRRPGAAALDLAYVAAGYYDGFWEIGLNPWDVAAASLLITEAGGLIGDLAGEEGYLYGGQVLAGNPRIFAQMITALAPHAAAVRAMAPARPAPSPAVADRPGEAEGQTLAAEEFAGLRAKAAARRSGSASPATPSRRRTKPAA